MHAEDNPSLENTREYDIRNSMYPESFYPTFGVLL